MGELLPCPFCGGEAGLFEVKGIGNDLLGYMVGCTEDYCEIRPSITKDLDKDGAIKAWNTRTPKERRADFTCKNCTEWDEDECECSHWYGFHEGDFCSHGTPKERGGEK